MVSGKQKSVSVIPSPEANFLKAEIESTNVARAKRALQVLCRLYRQNVRLSPKDIDGVEHAIIGALCSGRSDEKVRRWSLSAISQLGRAQFCWMAVKNAISNYPDEPQVLSSAIAALFKLNEAKAAGVILDTDVIAPEILTLSALQTVQSSQVQLPKVVIDIETADAMTLKLALVLVGLDRCPEQLFHPKFSNRQIVKVLGGHHERLVSQYSAWATAENPNLTTADLGIDVKSLSDQYENVRAYVYRLYSAENIYSKIGHGLLMQSVDDESNEARLGSAMGLRDTYYEGIEEVTLKWLFDEPDDEVRLYLLDHTVRQADKCTAYHATAKELFETEADGLVRARMQASAAKTSLHKEFLAIVHEEEEGLFSTGRLTIVNNNSFVNNGNVQGQVSLSGEASNSGTQTNQAMVGSPEKARETLGDVKALVEGLTIEHALKQEVADAVAVAHDKPQKETIDRVVDVLKKVETAVGSATVTGAKLIGLGATLAGLF